MTPFWHIVGFCMVVNYYIEYPHLKSTFEFLDLIHLRYRTILIFFELSRLVLSVAFWMTWMSALTEVQFVLLT